MSRTFTEHKKGYWRKAYTRKDGTRVKKSWVPSTKFTAQRRGQGRGIKTLPTPKRKGALNDISMKRFGVSFTKLTAAQEKSVLRTANAEFGKKSTRSKLQEQVNFREFERSPKVVSERKVFERGVRQEESLV